MPHRGIGAVGLVARRDRHHPLGAVHPEAPFPPRGDGGALDHPMPGNRVRTVGHAACSQIAGGRHDHAPGRAHLPRDQAGIRQPSDAHRHVDPVFHQVHRAVRQFQCPGHLWIAVQEAAHQRRHVQAPEHQRRRHHQSAGRPRTFRLRRAVRFLQFRQNEPGPLQVSRADIRQGHGARRPLQQPHPQMVLQRRHRAGHGGRRQSQPPRGGGKSLQVGNRDKRGHGFQAVHGIIAT